MPSARDVIGISVLLACIVTVADCKGVYWILLEAENNAIAGLVSVKSRNGDRVAIVKETNEDNPHDIPQGDAYLRVVEIAQLTSTKTKMLETQPTVASNTSKASRRESTTNKVTVTSPIRTDTTIDTTTRSGSSADDAPDGNDDLTWVLPRNVQPAPHTNSHLHIIHSSNYHPPPPAHTIHRRDTAILNQRRVAADSIYIRSGAGDGTYSVLNTIDKTRPEGGVRGGGMDTRSIDPNHQLRAKQFYNDDLEIMKDAESRIGIFVRQRRNVATTPTSPPDQFVVAETTLFAVDNYGYIVVAEEGKLTEHTHVEFFVYVQSADGRAISNSVAFMVHVEHEKSNSAAAPVSATVFAGVLVLIVVLMAIIIPLVTRAKRRRRQGKPMFKLGSHASRADLQKPQTSETQVTLPHDRSEPNWYGDGKKVFYSYKEEVEQERKDFTQDIQHFAEGTGYASHTGATGNLPKSGSQSETLQLSKNSKNKTSESGEIGSGSPEEYKAASELRRESGGHENNAYKKGEIEIISSSVQGTGDIFAEGNTSDGKQSHRF